LHHLPPIIVCDISEVPPIGTKDTLVLKISLLIQNLSAQGMLS